MKKGRFFVIGIGLGIFGASQLYAVTEIEPIWVNQYGTTDPSGYNQHYYKGNFVVTDNSGSPYIMGTHNCQFGGPFITAVLSAKYNMATGNREWLYAPNSSQYYYGDVCKDIKIGPDGNIYMLTQYVGYLFKYTPTGTELFCVALGSYDSYWGGNSFNKMAIDKDGYIYVPGKYLVTSGGGSWTGNDVLRKLNPADGGTIWEVQYCGSKGAAFNDVALDADGNIYAVGIWTYISSPTPSTIVKYNSSGTLIWSKNISTNGFTDVSIRGSYLYVTGSANTLKYDLNGNQIWSNTTVGTKIEADADGNAYLLSSNNLIKYSPTGTILWSKAFGGTANDLVIDSYNNIYVTGSSVQTGKGNVVTTIAYYPANGDIAWMGRWDPNAPTVSYDAECGYGITIDNTGNVYVTGSCDNLNVWRWDVVTLKYPGAPLAIELVSFTGTSRAGDILLEWEVEAEINTKEYIIERDGNEICRVLATGVAGPKSYNYEDRKVASGREYEYKLGEAENNENITWYGPIRVRYRGKALPEKLNLSISPTISNKDFSILYELPQNNDISIKVYDESGSVIRVIFEGEESAGFHSSYWNGKGDNGEYVKGGTYFCVLKIDGSETRKVIIVK